MGLETLKSAERAAGFAMAPADEPCFEPPVETAVEPEDEAWRAREPVLATAAVDAKSAHASVADWVKGFFGFSGRRAPA